MQLVLDFLSWFYGTYLLYVSDLARLDIHHLNYLAISKEAVSDFGFALDNIAMIALACRYLKGRAWWWVVGISTLLAIAIRFGLYAGEEWLLQLQYAKLIGGILLIVAGIHLLHKLHRTNSDVAQVVAVSTVWVILMIAGADGFMSFDNVLAVYAIASQTDNPHAYGLIGIAISVPFLIGGAFIIGKAIRKYPFAAWVAAGIIGWSGAELAITDPAVSNHVHWVFTNLGVNPFGFLGAAAVLLTAYAAIQGRKSYAS